MNGAGNSSKNWSRPLGPGGGVEHHLISITKIIDFSFCRLGDAPGADLGVHGVKHLNVGICDGATSNARSCYLIIVSCFFFLFA